MDIKSIESLLSSASRSLEQYYRSLVSPSVDVRACMGDLESNTTLLQIAISRAILPYIIIIISISWTLGGRAEKATSLVYLIPIGITWIAAILAESYSLKIIFKILKVNIKVNYLFACIFIYKSTIGPLLVLTASPSLYFLIKFSKITERDIDANFIEERLKISNISEVEVFFDALGRAFPLYSYVFPVLILCFGVVIAAREYFLVLHLSKLMCINYKVVMIAFALNDIFSKLLTGIVLWIGGLIAISAITK